jgi:hypothetical protein
MTTHGLPARVHVCVYMPFTSRYLAVVAMVSETIDHAKSGSVHKIVSSNVEDKIQRPMRPNQ